MSSTSSVPTFVICVKNDGYPASLEVRKLYVQLPDDKSAQYGLIRVVDESGEDYLYPTDYFLAVELPQSVIEALSVAA